MKKVFLLLGGLCMCNFIFATVAVPDSIIVSYLTANSRTQTIWDKNSGPIITGIISFIAIISASLLSYFSSTRNLNKQLKFQLATTARKEWVENVRKCVAEILSRANNIKIHKEYPQISKLDIDANVDEIVRLGSTIQLYLNMENQYEGQLMTAIEELAKMILGVHSNINHEDFLTKYGSVVVAAHELFTYENTK